MPISRYVTVFGKKMWIDVAEGEVVSQQKWAETHVSSSGGDGWVSGGYNTPVYATIRPVNIHSNTTTNHEFWVREPDEKENSFSFANVDFPVRDGHRVRLAWASAEGFKKGDHVFATNLTAGKTVEHKTIAQWFRYLKLIGIVNIPAAYRPIKFGLALASAFALRAGASMLIATPDALLDGDRVGFNGGSDPIDQAKGLFAVLIEGLKDYKPAASQLLSLDFTHQAIVLGFVAFGFYIAYSVLGRIFYLPGWRTRRTRAVRDVLWQEFQQPVRQG